MTKHPCHRPATPRGSPAPAGHAARWLRPPVKWHGGKRYLAQRIIAKFPPHRIYLEPFGGAASVLLNKPPCEVEVYNDLDGEVVNVFRVLRDTGAAAELKRLIAMTPFARAEFEQSYEPAVGVVEQARRTIVRSFLGFGSDSASGATTGTFPAARAARIGFGRHGSGSPTQPSGGTGTGGRSSLSRPRTGPCRFRWPRPGARSGSSRRR